MRALHGLLLAMTLAGLAHAGDVEPPVLDVSAGLTGDETVRAGWSPFEVVLTATGSPLELVVELALGESSEQLAAGQGWRCERSVSLGPGQRRRLWFMAPVRARRWGGLTYRVMVRTAGEAPRELAVEGPRSLTVEPRSTHYYNYSRAEARTPVLVVSDSAEPRDVDWLARERRRDHAGPPRVGIRPPARLPEAALAYDAVDLVVVRDADLSALRPAQADALVAWVEDGGRVLLIPPHDPAWFGERTVARLVEGRRARVEDDARLPSLVSQDGTRHQPPPVSTLVLERAAMVDLDAGLRLRRAPAAASWLQGIPRGRGEVWVLAADVGREPFVRWPGADVLGAAITATSTPRASGAAREPEETLGAMQAVSVRDAPARWLVVGLVLVYVVVVGPLNDRLLRRKGALLLLVATIPAVALAWTLLVFSVGWATKGLSTVSRRLTLLSVRQGETLARERTLLGLRAASAAEYEVAFGPGLESFQLERPYEQQLASRDLVAFDEAQGQTHRVPLRLWSQAAFDAEGLRRLKGPLRVTQAGGVTTLENGSEHALDLVVAVGRQGTLVGGPTPAGGRVALAAAPAPAQDEALQDTLAEQRRLLGRHDGSGALVELALRLGAHPQDAQAVSALLQELGVTPGGAEPPIVLARLAAPPSLATVEGRERADRELLLLVAHPPRPEAE